MEHGTLSMYTRGYCRCDECRAAQASYMRKYRARKRSEEEREERMSKQYEHKEQGSGCNMDKVEETIEQLLTHVEGMAAILEKVRAGFK
jgi:hypothetical protein